MAMMRPSGRTAALGVMALVAGGAAGAFESSFLALAPTDLLGALVTAFSAILILLLAASAWPPTSAGKGLIVCLAATSLMLAVPVGVAISGRPLAALLLWSGAELFVAAALGFSCFLLALAARQGERPASINLGIAALFTLATRGIGPLLYGAFAI